MKFFTFLLLRTATYPMRWLPQSWIHLLGSLIGSSTFYLVPRLKKRAMSNLALAKDLSIPFDQIPSLAKKSLQSLAITCLEFVKFSYTKNMNRYVDLQDDSGDLAKGAIFACAHQANWELFFLQGSLLFPLIGIGKPFKNPHLYRFVKTTRERFGGKLYPPKNGVKECLKALKAQKVVGLIVDQATPGQGIQTTFFGRKVYSSSIAALLSYKTGVPVVPATLVRGEKKYEMRFHPPLHPDLTKPIDEEVARLVETTLKTFEASIREHPAEWLWIHNRYKQDPRGFVNNRYRSDTLLVILSDKESPEEVIMNLRPFYPESFITLLVPKKYRGVFIADVEIIVYDSPEEMLLNDYRFKLVLNYTENQTLYRHYKSLSAFHVIENKDIQKVLSHA